MRRPEQRNKRTLSTEFHRAQLRKGSQDMVSRRDSDEVALCGVVARCKLVRCVVAREISWVRELVLAKPPKTNYVRA